MVSAVTITVNTFHFRPKTIIEPATQREAIATGNNTATAGTTRRVSTNRTRQDTLSEIAVERICEEFKPSTGAK